jgi:hypothetical protein
MRRSLAVLLASFALALAASPAWADGAAPDDCPGKKVGDACTNFDMTQSGVCAADGMGILYCDIAGGGGGGGGAGGGGAGGGGAGTGAAGSSSGCSFDRARAGGGSEAIGIGLLFAACVAVARRRR